MPGMYRSLYDTLKILPLYNADPAGVGDIDTAVYADMRLYAKIAVMVHRTSVTDLLDKFQLLQATSAAGAGAKAISGKTLTSVIAGLTAAGDRAIIEADAADLDTENDFFFLGARISLAADTGANQTEILGIADPIHANRSQNTLAAGAANGSYATKNNA